MEIKLLKNNSDKRYINKDITEIATIQNAELIEPVSIIRPRLIFSEESRIKESNYIYIPDLTRFYYIEDYVYEYDRIIVICKVDVLQSFNDHIMQEKVILERISKQKNLQNFYLNDPEIKILSYPFIEHHTFKVESGGGFNQDSVFYILAVAGAINGSENKEGGNS